MSIDRKNVLADCRWCSLAGAFASNELIGVAAGAQDAVMSSIARSIESQALGHGCRYSKMPQGRGLR